MWRICIRFRKLFKKRRFIVVLPIDDGPRVAPETAAAAALPIAPSVDAAQQPIAPPVVDDVILAQRERLPTATAPEVQVLGSMPSSERPASAYLPSAFRSDYFLPRHDPGQLSFKADFTAPDHQTGIELLLAPYLPGNFYAELLELPPSAQAVLDPSLSMLLIDAQHEALGSQVLQYFDPAVGILAVADLRRTIQNTLATRIHPLQWGELLGLARKTIGDRPTALLLSALTLQSMRGQPTQALQVSTKEFGGDLSRLIRFFTFAATAAFAFASRAAPAKSTRSVHLQQFARDLDHVAASMAAPRFPPTPTYRAWLLCNAVSYANLAKANMTLLDLAASARIDRAGTIAGLQNAEVQRENNWDWWIPQRRATVVNVRWADEPRIKLGLPSAHLTAARPQES
jgi:hypothetical protein